MVAFIMKWFAVIGLTILVYTWTLKNGGFSIAFTWGSLMCSWSMIWALATFIITARVPAGKG